MKITAILQARMSSSRLPNKVLKEIVDKPMLQLQIERIQRSVQIDQIVLATSNESSDDPIEQLCQKISIDCFRGELEDVLDRFYQASIFYGGDHIVRLTGDCPVIDPDIIDQVIEYHLKNGADYTSNTNPPSYPDGLDVEVMTKKALTQAWHESRLPSQREHVTPYIYQSGLFKIINFKNNIDLSHLRWTVDQQEDFDLITFIYEKLYKNNPYFNYKDILALMDNSGEVGMINTHIKRNEGYQKSLEKDRNIF